LVKVKVKSSKKFKNEFIKEIEDSVREVVEGRAEDFEKLMEKYGVKPKKVRA